MKVIATILEDIKSRFPHTDLSAVLIMAMGASTPHSESKLWPVSSEALALAWGCSAEEVELLGKWGVDVDHDDLEDIWAEVGH